MRKYLYGASVQGIQNFIFQTNKLQEIVGASELIAEICNEFFRGKFKEWGIPFFEDAFLLGAAGNIKYIFDNKEDCQKVVNLFPKAVMEMADGITISQAVVEVGKYPDDIIQELEKRLRIRRNKAISIRENAGLMVTETARRTGGVGYKYVNKDENDEEVIDYGQSQKIDAADSANKRLTEDIFESKHFNAKKFPFDISEMVKGEENQSWVAVIHADGNSLGKKLIKMGSLLKGDDAKKAFKDFSQKLDDSTKQAAKIAFNEVVVKFYEEKELEKIPFRPVVLGGDDLTAIIRGDLALDFTHRFLEEFEKITKENYVTFDADHQLNETVFAQGLTACAGIAFIKANYPFHYGVNLAESLCQQAKNAAKKINEEHAPSSLMFHKVHASFVEDFEDIIEKELRAENNVFFNYGPYFIRQQESYDTVVDLKERIKSLNKKDAPKSGLRNWLTELQNNPNMAEQTLERIASLSDKSRYLKELNLSHPFAERRIKLNGEELDGKFTPIFDAMVISNI